MVDNWSHLTVPDRVTIDLDYRSDLTDRSGEESLLRCGQFRQGDGPFLNRDGQLSGQIERGLAGDASQDIVGKRGGA